jgi:F-type H+-transporting ATPase subunit alpha
MVELLKQPQYQPLNVVDQILSIFAGTKGFLDRVPVNQVREWEQSFLEFVHSSKQSLWDRIQEKNDLDNELEQEIRAVLKEFNERYLAASKDTVKA